MNQPLHMDNEVVWEGHPSHWIFINQWMVAILLIPVGVGILWAFYLKAKVRTTVYRITNERLIWQYGIFTRHTEQTELYRVRGIEVKEPFALRAQGIGHVHVHTTDSYNPIEQLAAVKNPREVAELLRAAVDRVRRERGIRAVEVGGT